MQPEDEQAEAIAAFIEALRPVKVGRGGYTRLDRYRDFKATFSTEPGKRVLAQIIDLCEGPVPSEHDIDNHAKLAGRAMMRRVGALVSAWATVPPPEDNSQSETQGDA